MLRSGKGIAQAIDFHTVAVIILFEKAMEFAV